MNLFILDKDPKKSAQLIPDGVKWKMLLELAQLICSAGISDVYKQMPQGKNIQQWIINNPVWTYLYFIELLWYCHKNINMSMTTIIKMERIKYALSGYCWEKYGREKLEYAYDNGISATNGYFRFSDKYEITDKEHGQLLQIDECIEEYKRYIQWKIDNKTHGYVKKEILI
jgi:hypothetical protein